MPSVKTAVAAVLRGIIKPLGGELRFTREDVPGLQGTGTGVEYWREGLERRMPRYWELVWRGRVLARVRSDHNERAYWRSRRDLIDLIDEMSVAKLLPRLDARSRVLEPGCNVAQNLWEISRRWNCDIYGLDIDRGTLDHAAKRPWPKTSQFVYGNVLERSTFEKFSDRQFDLVFTRWHLIHVPPGDAKRHYLNELKRIGKSGLILEPTSPQKTGTVEWRQENTYCLSWDDWEKWYGLKRYTPVTAIPYTDVFYW